MSPLVLGTTSCGISEQDPCSPMSQLRMFTDMDAPHVSGEASSQPIFCPRTEGHSIDRPLPQSSKRFVSLTLISSYFRLAQKARRTGGAPPYRKRGIAWFSRSSPSTHRMREGWLVRKVREAMASSPGRTAVASPGSHTPFSRSTRSCRTFH